MAESTDIQFDRKDIRFDSVVYYFSILYRKTPKVIFKVGFSNEIDDIKTDITIHVNGVLRMTEKVMLAHDVPTLDIALKFLIDFICYKR
jgi:hypothetical protein